MFRSLGIAWDCIAEILISISTVVTGTGEVLVEGVEITKDEVSETGVQVRIGHVKDRRVMMQELKGLKCTKAEMAHIYRRGTPPLLPASK